MKYFSINKLILIFFLFSSSIANAQNLTLVYCGNLFDTKSGEWIENALIHIDPATEKIIEMIPNAKVILDQNICTRSIRTLLFARINRYAYPYS
jgi:hypothetical protein